MMHAMPTAGLPEDNRRPWALIGAAGLLLSIAALGAMFLTSVERATGHFARAAMSQAQFADALAVRDAARAEDASALRVALGRYRASIADEVRLLPAAERPFQAAERADADALARLVARPGQTAEIDRLVGRIAEREQAEAAETALQVETLKRRARLLAILLTAAAVLSALLGAAGLVSANRRLSRAVAIRTAQIAGVDASRRLFFAKVSHELRTPVTVLRGEAEVALKTADAHGLAAALAEVVGQSELLGRRLDELLALSQAEDGRITLGRDPVDLTALAHAAAQRSQRYATSNGVTLAVETAEPLTTIGDARWLEQAVVALIDNAIKFSPDGGRVEIQIAPAGSNAARLTVADRGNGVAPDALPRLFDAYYQTAEGRARGGNGLGLALSHWVVEQHGGSARAMAREGGGCQISLDLPVAA